MTEPYSRIGLTSEQYSSLRGEANLNSVVTCLIKPKVLSDLQQICKICK